MPCSLCLDGHSGIVLQEIFVNSNQAMAFSQCDTDHYNDSATIVERAPTSRHFRLFKFISICDSNENGTQHSGFPCDEEGKEAKEINLIKRFELFLINLIVPMCLLQVGHFLFAQHKTFVECDSILIESRNIHTHTQSMYIHPLNTQFSSAWAVIVCVTVTNHNIHLTLNHKR